jgi:hypothetical protein
MIANSLYKRNKKYIKNIKFKNISFAYKLRGIGEGAVPVGTGNCQLWQFITGYIKQVILYTSL